MADTEDQIRAREAQVLAPPRVLPLDRHENAELAHASAARLRKASRGDVPPLELAKIPEIVFTMLRYPDLWEALCQFSIHLLGPNSVLPKRPRQLAILRTGWLLGAPFEWGEHVGLSKTLGITSEEIERVTIGSSAPEWTADDRAVLRAAEELREDAFVSDLTWEVLGRTLDDHQRVELLMLVGQFTTVAYFQNSMRLRLEGYNSGLSAR